MKTNISDKELIELFQINPEEAANYFIKNYKGFIINMAKRYLGAYSLEETQDVLSDVLNEVVVNMKITQVRNPDVFPVWLKQLIKNKSKNLLRKKISEREKIKIYANEVTTKQYAPSRNYGEIDTILAIMRKRGYCIEVELLLGHFVQQRTFSELAVNFRIKRHKVVSIIQRAIKIFKEYYCEENAKRQMYTS